MIFAVVRGTTESAQLNIAKSCNVYDVYNLYPWLLLLLLLLLYTLWGEVVHVVRRTQIIQYLIHGVAP